MKKIIVLLLILSLLFPAAGCASNSREDGAAAPNGVSSDRLVGISVPEETAQYWSDSVSALRAGLEDLGCRVQVSYGQNDASLQAQQIAELVATPVDCLVVATIDPLALTDVLQQAKAAGIPVIAYDRLLTLTDAVSVYVGFDNHQIGISMASHIARAKQLDTALAEGRSYSIEFFMGSPEDPNALLLHQGILQVLQPYLDSGVLVCNTQRTAFEDVCIQDWSGQFAKTRCEAYLAEFYTETAPDILCAASDELAGGCCAALEEAGYAPAEGWPLITGQDAQPEAVRRILSGHQAMTVYKDPGALLQNCLKAAEAFLTDTPLQTGDTGCHNGSFFVPAILTVPVAVDEQNYREVLIDSGVITEAQLTEETT